MWKPSSLAPGSGTVRIRTDTASHEFSGRQFLGSGGPAPQALQSYDARVGSSFAPSYSTSVAGAGGGGSSRDAVILRSHLLSLPGKLACWRREEPGLLQRVCVRQ